MAEAEGGSEQDDVSFLRTVSFFVFFFLNLIFLLYENYNQKHFWLKKNNPVSLRLDQGD